MKKYLLFLICIIFFNTFAAGTLTKIQQGVTIYSEYYPNTKSKFKGTIIFENGSGTDISEWKSNKKFFNCVKKIGSIFLYDRSGLGKSPPNLQLSVNNPLTAKLVSDQLSKLLKKLNINPPYIFVAHSYGAMYAGYFILKNPNLVKGVLLVDPVPRDFNFSNKQMKKLKIGIEEAKIKSANYIYKKYDGQKTEVFYQLLGFDESKQSIKLLGEINNSIPVIVISSTEMRKKHPIEKDWYESQKQWINKNVMSKLSQVSSNHFIQLEQPQKICNKFKQVLNYVY